MDEQNKKSFNYLFTDLIERILAMAGNPGSCAQFTAETLRSLIGARTVLVMECSSFSSSHEHEVVSVFPLRRKPIAELKTVRSLAALSHTLSSAAIFFPSEKGPIPEILRKLEVGPTILSPLISGPERVGVIILLDLMDTQNVESILDTLNDLSRVLALILRNAFLYQYMEQEVQARTRELEEKNQVLVKALQEKDLMLKELHHRVKNNLQIINSLLYLQASNSKQPEVREALKTGQNRIYSMALVHEELYQSEDLECIDLIGSTRKLAANLIDLLHKKNISIQVKGNTDTLLLPILYSVPIGLILNELITNSIKHAYPEDSGGPIFVRILKQKGTISIAVEDEGIGFSETLDYYTGKTLGLTLISNLSEQLRGSFCIQNKKSLSKGEAGTLATLMFPWESGTDE
ncbi:MAG: histidine kinase dimerization/phosphoacceptor domain -containing protein [Spirochaetales bacterium]